MSKLVGVPFKHTPIGDTRCTVLSSLWPVISRIFVQFIAQYKVFTGKGSVEHGRNKNSFLGSEKFCGNILALRLTSPVIDLHCSTVACLIRRDYSNVLRAVAHERDIWYFKIQWTAWLQREKTTFLFMWHAWKRALFSLYHKLIIIAHFNWAKTQ